MLFILTAIVLNSGIVVLDGDQTFINGENDASKKFFIYEANSDQWLETTPLAIKKVFFGFVTIGNKIYVIGETFGDNPNWDTYPTIYEGAIIQSLKIINE